MILSRIFRLYYMSLIFLEEDLLRLRIILSISHRMNLIRIQPIMCTRVYMMKQY